MTPIESLQNYLPEHKEAWRQRNQMNDAFAALVRDIPRLGIDWHRETILANSRAYTAGEQSIRAIPPDDRPALIVSAGPSLYRHKSLERAAALRHKVAIVAIDGSYIQCLRANIVPDYVLTLDPHPTRIVRWFGDPDYAAHTAEDDYFARQDLDEGFRAEAARVNAENIDIVDAFASVTKLVICSTAPANVVARTAKMPRFWFAPLVDNPKLPGSLTREVAEATRLPALNTGGTVGTAAVMFAHCILRTPSIAAVGMDLGYAADMPLERTQSWNMLKDRKDVRELYPIVEHPAWGRCYTDCTYFWYRQNLLALLKSAGRTLYNCTEGGALYGPHVECTTLEEWANPLYILDNIKPV